MKALPKTQVEEDFGFAFSKEQWDAYEALDKIAEDLANHCCKEINRLASQIPRDPIKYNEQHALEELIKKLQARV
jgi:hypothetical protein